MSQEPASLFVACRSSTKARSTSDFIAFGTGSVHFGIQKAEAANDPPGVLTWQIRVTDIERAMERCQSADISFELEHNEPAPGWTYRCLLIRSPGTTGQGRRAGTIRAGQPRPELLVPHTVSTEVQQRRLPVASKHDQQR